MARRKLILVILLAVGVPFALLLIAGLVYWRWANHIPDYPRTPVSLPAPNARDDYIAAGQLCRAVSGSKVLDTTGKPLLRNGRALLGYEPETSLAQARAVVARNRRALERLRLGFRKSFYTPPVTSFSQQFPEFAHYRELARVLITEGKLAEREGRERDAVRSYLDCLHLGVTAPKGGPIIHGLVGVAIQTIGLRPLHEVIDRVDGPTAALAAREMDWLNQKATGLAETLAVEKDTATEILADMFRRPGGTRQLLDPEPGKAEDLSSDVRTAAGVWLSLAPKRRILDNLRGYLDELIALCRQPSYARAAPPPLPRDPFSRVLASTYNDARPKWGQRDAWWRMAQTRLAVRAYREKHRRLPPTLAALTPDLLPAVPPDPFAAQPLVYRTHGSRVVIYSRGPDGDDDGGRDLGSQVKPEGDGDLVTLRVLSRRAGQPR
jgi:hypothetical protein